MTRSRSQHPQAGPHSSVAANRTSEAGFTLMEVLISLLVLVSGMVSVLALFTHSVQIHQQAVDDARTAMVAEAVLDRLRFEWEESGDPSALQTMTFEDETFRPYQVETDVASYGRDNEDAVAVTITLRWRRGAREPEVVFRSVLLRNGFAARVQAARAGRLETQ